MSVIEYRKRREERLNSRREDDGWITINGTHVLVDDDKNIKEGPEALKRLPKKEKNVIDSRLMPSRNDYDYDPDDSFQEFTHKNVEKLRDMYEEFGRTALEDEWFSLRLGNCTGDFKEITDEEIDEAFEKYINPNTARAWLLEYNSHVKPGLVMQLTSSKEVHNAALNVMYENYKYQCERDKVNPLPYEEFLVTPLKMYRGGSGKEYREAAAFSSYTFDKSVAERFKSDPSGYGNPNAEGVVYEAEIRPIDTYGSLNTSGESEIFVPKKIAPNKNFDEAPWEELGWKWNDKIRKVFDDYEDELREKEEQRFELNNDLLDSIIRDVEMIELFLSGKSERDKEAAPKVVERCIDSIQRSVGQMTAMQGAVNGDGAFFEGELDENIGERNVQYPEVEAFKERRKKRLDAKEDDGRWITTEGGHKVHLNEEGEPDKGNPYVVDYMGSGGGMKELNDRAKEIAESGGDWRDKYESAMKLIREVPVGQGIHVWFGDYIKVKDTDDINENAFSMGMKKDPGASLADVARSISASYQSPGEETDLRFFDQKEKVRDVQDKIDSLRKENKISGSDEVKDNEKGLINAESPDYGKPGEYVIYRSGELTPGKMNFFATTKPGADSYEGAVEGRKNTAQYRVKLEDPIVIKGDSDGECVVKAYEMLNPGKSLKGGPMTLEKWKRMDRANNRALTKSGHDAIIYIIKGKPAEVQLPGKNVEGRVKKLGEYTTTKWSRIGRSIEDAIYDGYFDKDPRDYVRVDSVVDKFRERRKKRLDAREEPAEWITVNGNHIPIDEEGNPIGGQKKALGKSAGDKKMPLTKKRINQNIADIINSEKSDDEKLAEIKKELEKLPKGSKVQMPDSWENDNGTIDKGVWDGRYWVMNGGKGVYGYHMSMDDMVSYMNVADESERPKISSVAHSEETQKRKALEREYKKDKHRQEPNGGPPENYRQAYGSEEEYRKTWDSAVRSFDSKEKKIEDDYNSGKEKIDEKYGSFSEQRFEVRHNDNLTAEEKENKLREIEENVKRRIEELDALSKERARERSEARKELYSHYDPDYDYKAKENECSLREDALAVNPKFFDSQEYRENCTHCGLAFEMRCRGYDVEATPVEGGETSAGFMFRLAFSDYEAVDVSGGNEGTIQIVEKMREWGDGARAIINTLPIYGTNVGHTYNVINREGNILFIDSQSGAIMDTDSPGDSVYGGVIEKTTGADLIRVDQSRIYEMPEGWIKNR